MPNPSHKDVMMLNTLPDELIYLIATKLDIDTLSQLSQVSKQFNNILKKNPELWIYSLRQTNEYRAGKLLKNKSGPLLQERSVSKSLLNLAKKHHHLLDNVSLYDSSKIVNVNKNGYENERGTVKAIQMLSNNRMAVWCYGYENFDRGLENIINIYDIRKNTRLKTFTLLGDTATILQPLSDVTVAMSNNRLIEIWDIDHYQRLQTLEGHTGFIASLGVLEDGCLLSGADNGVIKIWNLHNDNDRCIMTLHEPEYSARITSMKSISADILLSGDAHGNVLVWNLKTGNCLKSFNVGSIHDIQCLDYANGQIACAYERTIKIWNIKTGRLQDTFTVKERPRYHTSVACLKFLPDGNLVSGSGSDITIWDLQKSKSINTITCDSTIVHSPLVQAFAYQSGCLYAGLGDGLIHRFELSRLNLQDSNNNNNRVSHKRSHE